MERFVKRHGDRIAGSIAGFDRMLFRSNLSSICHVEGMDRFLSSQHVLYKDFSAFGQRISQRVKECAEQMARDNGRPLIYLSSPKKSKEDFVRAIIERDQITNGLVCILACVEPCRSFSIRGDRGSKKTKLVAETRQCQHLYFYFLDHEFGLLHVRLQTWLPLTIQVCLNGREYLARQMLQANINYRQADNCFTAIGNFQQAQRIMDELVERRWKPFLDALAQRVNPWLNRKATLGLRPYYWTVRQGEYATDILFRDPQALADIYPSLVDHAIKHFHTEDVLRFLGRKARSIGSGEVKSDRQRRYEGVRVKHWVHENSIKMYDKQGSVLRIETTINNPKRFRVRRRLTRQGPFKWLPLRKGIADIRRRAQLSRAANERYLEALAVVGAPTPSHKLLDKVSTRVVRGRQKFRALRPISPEDSRLFKALLNGKFLIQGVRNKDLRQWLFPDPLDREQARKHASRVTRSLTLLKSHNLIYRVPKTNYYRITKLGNEIMTTATKFRETNIALLAA
jgi:predicted transposase YbfD/YdcC